MKNPAITDTAKIASRFSGVADLPTPSAYPGKKMWWAYLKPTLKSITGERLKKTPDYFKLGGLRSASALAVSQQTPSKSDVETF